MRMLLAGASGLVGRLVLGLCQDAIPITRRPIGRPGVVADFDDLVFDDGLPEPPANYQGLWWKPSESGWGVNFAHQGDVVFAGGARVGLGGVPKRLCRKGL